MDLLETLRKAADDFEDAATALESLKDGEGLGYFLRERARRYRGIIKTEEVAIEASRLRAAA